MSVRVFAPAKINLTLEVGPARADGRHPLRSLVAFASIGDWVEALPAAKLSLETSGPFAMALAGDSDNLVSRAARALREASGVPTRGAALRLEKNLPVASGIGGGSSDAAAALKALNELWGLGYGEARLCEIGARLGADVPACVVARAGLMSGTGEDFTPARGVAQAAVLVNPGVALATGDVYRQFDAMGGAGAIDESAAPAVRNDLEAPALALKPEIGAARDALLSGAGVQRVAMSGSGATWFALMENRASAESLANEIARAHPDWWVQATMLGEL